MKLKPTNQWIPTTLLAGLLTVAIILAGCTSTTSPNNTTDTITTVTTHSPPTPTPTPNPYGLDTDGYYIADDISPSDKFTYIFDRTKYGYNPKLKKEVIIFDDTPNLSITPLTPNITSGEALLFEGTTTHPPNSYIMIMKNPGVARSDAGGAGIQYFYAPVLPGTNGTNIIKFKIPALNIHIDQWTRKDPSFPANETYSSDFYGFGVRKGFVFTITSDPNYPMIWDSEGRSVYTWLWTNDTTTKHIINYRNASESFNPQPYPTYPKLPNTVFYPTLPLSPVSPPDVVSENSSTVPAPPASPSR